MTVVASTTFTPTVAGRVIVTVIYDAQRTAGGSDWAAGGTFVRGRAYLEQSSTFTYGTARGTTTARTPFSSTVQADVAAGALVTVGLDAQVGGLITCDFWDIHIKWELIKR